MVMSTILDPIESEFTSKEEEESYSVWFTAKVEAALMKADSKTSQRFTSDEITRRMDLLIKAAEMKNASRRMA
jgi:hypothetical protein